MRLELGSTDATGLQAQVNPGAGDEQNRHDNQAATH